MKTFVEIIIFSTLLAAAYGVLFSTTYPLVPIDGPVLLTVAFLGLATSVVLVGLWKAVRGKKR